MLFIKRGNPDTRCTHIDAEGKTTRAPSVGQIELAPGTWLTGLEVAGGGYGSPVEREPERVLDDVLEGYISLDHAGEVYGVEFKGRLEDGSLVVDAARTTARRSAMGGTSA